MLEEGVNKVLESLQGSNVTYGWGNTFASALDMNLYQSQLGVATGLAHALCGLFALFYVCRIVWKSWANGTQLDIYKCIKPFAIGMAIMFFGTITSAVDFLADSLTYATQEFNSKCAEKSSNQFKEVIGWVQEANTVQDETTQKKEGYDNPAGGVKIEEGTSNTNNQQEDVDDKTHKSSIRHMLEIICNFPDTMAALFLKGIYELIRNLAVLATSIVCCCILCMGFVGRCIFYFFGPFLFAMELIPGMEGRIVSWFKKYLTYSLYPCVINLVGGILVLLMVNLSDMLMSVPWDVYKFQKVEHMSLVQLVISCIAIFMFMSIPSVVSQIMETASNGLGGSGMIPVSFAAGKVGDRIADKIGKGGATAATGGASLLAEIGKGAGNMGKQMSSDSNFKL